MHHVVDFFNLDEADETIELAAKFLCSMRGKDPDVVAHTGRAEWVSYLQEAKEHFGLFAIFQKSNHGAVHHRVIHNGHVEEAEIVDAPRPD